MSDSSSFLAKQKAGGRPLFLLSPLLCLPSSPTTHVMAKGFQTKDRINATGPHYKALGSRRRWSTERSTVTVATVTAADVRRFAFVSGSHKRDFWFLRIFRRADSFSYISGWGPLNVPTQLKVATEEHPARSRTTATDRRVLQKSGTPGSPELMKDVVDTNTSRSLPEAAPVQPSLVIGPVENRQIQPALGSELIRLTQV